MIAFWVGWINLETALWLLGGAFFTCCTWLGFIPPAPRRVAMATELEILRARAKKGNRQIRRIWDNDRICSFGGNES